VAGRLRLEHPQASLEQLGALADPPMTKDAVAGRLRRLRPGLISASPAPASDWEVGVAAGAAAPVRVRVADSCPRRQQGRNGSSSDWLYLLELAGVGAFKDQCGHIQREALRGPSVQTVAAGPFPVGGPGEQLDVAGEFGHARIALAQGCSQ